MEIAPIIIKRKHRIMISVAVIILLIHCDSALKFIHYDLLDLKFPKLSLVAVELFVLWLICYFFLMILSNYYQSTSKNLEQDTLTGLKNRRYLDTADQRVEKERKNNLSPCVSVLVLDLDDFKQINDTYGHDIGDKTLVRIGEVLHSNVRENDECYRIGGDEFVIILKGESERATTLLAKRIQHAIHQDEKLRRLCHRPISASAGLASINIGQKVSDGILTADAYLYLAKRNGKGGLCSLETH